MIFLAWGDFVLGDTALGTRLWMKMYRYHEGVGAQRGDCLTRNAGRFGFVVSFVCPCWMLAQRSPRKDILGRGFLEQIYPISRTFLFGKKANHACTIFDLSRKP